MIKVTILPILEDNYAYLIQEENGKTAIIDAGEALPVIDYLEKHHIKLDYIFSTHHHWDHVNGNQELSQKYSAPIYVPENDARKIKHFDYILKDNEIFSFGSEEITIIKTSGHTLGGVCLWLKKSKILFTGDTLFSLGCGRLFEGTAKDLFLSFQKIASLPEDTLIYCGHEYTLMNGSFCASITPDNEALFNRIENSKKLRQQNKPTIPIDLKTEKETNVFFKAKTPEEFLYLRELRNNFKVKD